MSGRYLEELIEHSPIVEEAKPEIKIPRKYKVFLLKFI